MLCGTVKRLTAVKPQHPAAAAPDAITEESVCCIWRHRRRGEQEYGIPFMETSAKTGVNVELAFMAVAKELKQRSSSPDDHKFQIHQYIESQKKKSGCCGLL